MSCFLNTLVENQNTVACCEHVLFCYTSERYKLLERLYIAIAGQRPVVEKRHLFDFRRVNLVLHQRCSSASATASVDDETGAAETYVQSNLVGRR